MDDGLSLRIGRLLAQEFSDRRDLEGVARFGLRLVLAARLFERCGGPPPPPRGGS